MDVRVRNLPNEIHRKLKAQAALKGIPLEKYIADILEREVEKEEKEQKKK